MDRLGQLESKSIYIMREAKAQFGDLGILWSGGKDSTTLIHLAMNAFSEDVMKENIHVIHLVTGHKFTETYSFMNKIIFNWKISPIWARCYEDDEAIAKNAFPNGDKFECCNLRKTHNLRKLLSDWKIDAVMVGIRRDEQEIRNKERFFSPRSTLGEWDIWSQPLEMQGWDLYVESVNEGEHMRVHPLLEWSEVDVWRYIQKYSIPVNPLYFSQDGKRMRSIGCAPCTSFIKSEAKTIDEIIAEIEQRGGTEREGRTQDKEAGMQRLRALGYM